jgi:hypothetical protein
VSAGKQRCDTAAPLPGAELMAAFTRRWTLQQIAAADARLVEAAKDVKVLSYLAWPARLAEEFLAHWRAGDPRLPEPPRSGTASTATSTSCGR